MKNNLFYYATSELSQDAFICWLCSFALKDVEVDSVLKECAKELISIFVPYLKNQQFELLNIERQVDHIDVLITVKTADKSLKIIVEDKTHTNEHDNQLEKYKENISEKYPNCEVYGVYYKTGFQSDMSAVEQAGYNVVTRKQIVDFMRQYSIKTSNQIFLNYYAYWNDFQLKTEMYEDLPVSKWGWYQINGFYDSLKATNFILNLGLWMGYGYVPNKNGGFEGMWTGIDNCKILINNTLWELYLQMEMVSEENTSAQLCLKLCATDKNIDTETIRKVRNYIVYDEAWNYKLNEYNFLKPKRLSIGKYMTIGLYNADFSTARSIREAIREAAKDYADMLLSLNKEDVCL